MNVVNTVAVVTGLFQDNTSFNTVNTIIYFHINIELHNCVFQLEIIFGEMTSFYINNGKVAENCRHCLITPGEPQLDREDTRMDTSGTASRHFKELSFKHCSYNSISDLLLAATTIQQQPGNLSN